MIHNYLFDMIKESLSNENYEAALGSLLKTAGKKCPSMILKMILDKLEDIEEDKSRLQY